MISPRVSKKIDERGQGAIVVPATCVALSGCAILLVAVLLKLPIALCFVGAVLMGFLPTPQALTRARWVYLVKSGRLGDGAPELKTVFSYEGVMDDIVFMVSPRFPSRSLRESTLSPVWDAALSAAWWGRFCSRRLRIPSRCRDGKRSLRTGKAPRLPIAPKMPPRPSPVRRPKAREAEAIPRWIGIA